MFRRMVFARCYKLVPHPFSSGLCCIDRVLHHIHSYYMSRLLYEELVINPSDGCISGSWFLSCASPSRYVPGRYDQEATLLSMTNGKRIHSFCLILLCHPR